MDGAKPRKIANGAAKRRLRKKPERAKARLRRRHLSANNSLARVIADIALGQPA